MPSSDRFDTLGSKLGPKIARLVSEAIVATKRSLGPHEVRVRRQATQDVIDQAGREIAEHYRPLMRKILDADDGSLDPDVRQFIEDAISGEHQLKAIGGLVAGGVSSAIGLFLSNALAPLVYPVVRANPNLVLDISSSAQSAAAHITTLGQAQDSIMKQGFPAGAANQLVELAAQYPSVADALDLWRRGDITERQFILCLQRNSVPDQFIGPLAATKTVPLSPDLAALAVLRSVITQAEGQKIAAQSGVSAADFEIMIQDTGEPPGLEQLDEAYRRGFIDKARLEKGIRQSRVRNEWVDVIEALRFSPISVADAVNGVVQNHLTAAQAASIAEQNGLEPGWVNTLIQTAGEPLSRTEMEQLYNRGLVTKEQVLQALRESRLKDKYGNDAFELHVRLLEPRELSAAVEFGVISHADAVKRAMEHGFSPADATILINEGSARKLQTYKNRVVSAAETLYEAGGISETAFRNAAKSSGFDATEIDYLVRAADYRRKEKQVVATITAVRSRFIARHLTKNQAIGILDKAGLLAAQRDLLISTWVTEQSAIVRNLTEAQVIHAMKKQVITIQEADDRLIRLGYSQADAAILIASA